MSNLNSGATYQKFKYFNEKSDFEAPMKFMSELPPVPVEPKLINFNTQLDQSIKYNTTCLEMNQEQNLFADITGGFNLDLINPKVYDLCIPKSELTEDDLELSKMVLSADPNKYVKSNPTLNSTWGAMTSKELIAKLNAKQFTDQSRYILIRADREKVYGHHQLDPIKTITDYGTEKDKMISAGDPENNKKKKVI
jgi:hypothetical protein